MSHPTKPKRRSRAPVAAFRVGESVVPQADAFPGADPFTAYVVTAVHRDGSVDLVPTAGPAIERVRASKLLAV